VLALRGLKATIIFVEQNENVGKKRAAKMPHPNEIFGISISLLLVELRPKEASFFATMLPKQRPKTSTHTWP
jgi:hypothetical protein